MKNRNVVTMATFFMLLMVSHFLLSACMWNPDNMPSSHPDSIWKSEKVNAWVYINFNELTEGDGYDRDYYGEMTINDRVEPVKMWFSSDQAKQVYEVYIIVDDGEEDRRIEGICDCYEDKFVVNVKKDTLLGGKYDKITFVRTDESPNDYVAETSEMSEYESKENASAEEVSFGESETAENTSDIDETSETDNTFDDEKEYSAEELTEIAKFTGRMQDLAAQYQGGTLFEKDEIKQMWYFGENIWVQIVYGNGESAPSEVHKWEASRTKEELCGLKDNPPEEGLEAFAPFGEYVYGPDTTHSTHYTLDGYWVVMDGLEVMGYSFVDESEFKRMLVRLDKSIAT